MESKVSFFLPTRKGSQRVFKKNTRPFAGINGGLLQNKLEQLSNCKNLYEVILSTNDEECLEIGSRAQKYFEKLVLDERPEELCLDSTNLKDLIGYVPSVTRGEHIMWGHVTTPLATTKDYDDGIEKYLSALKVGYDSLISVCEFRNFLLNSQGNIINNNTKLPWPRTQDLEMLYEVNHVMFIASNDVYINTQNRVGDKPFLYTMEKINSLDVDWEEDFRIAEILYETIREI